MSAHARGIPSNAIAAVYARGRVNGTAVKWSVKDPAAMDADLSIMSSIQYNITVNAALIEVEKDLREGLISIQMFSWVSFLTMVLGAIAGTFQWQITVMSHLLKVLTFSQQTLVNNMNYFRSRFKYCELK